MTPPDAVNDLFANQNITNPQAFVDLDGDPRIDAETGAVDMGCYEYYGGGTLFLFY